MGTPEAPVDDDTGNGYTTTESPAAPEPGQSSAAGSQDDGGKCSLQEKIDLVAGMALDLSALCSPTMAELRDLRFSVSVADPQLPDCPLIAVSEGFCELTGYERESVVGQNCRFLNDGCDLDCEAAMGLRMASATGKRFCAVLLNRKKDGVMFHNLLDLRGLNVGRTESGEERWLLIAVQADVTEIADEEEGTLPDQHERHMIKVAQMICKNITSSVLQKAMKDATTDITEFYDKPHWIEGEAFVR